MATLNSRTQRIAARIEKLEQHTQAEAAHPEIIYLVALHRDGSDKQVEDGRPGVIMCMKRRPRETDADYNARTEARRIEVKAKLDALALL